MNRRMALAGSVSAASVLVAGAVMVGVLLSEGPAKHSTPELASAPLATDSAAVTSLDPVVVYQDEYEYVVTGGEGPASAGSSDVGSTEQSGGQVATSSGATPSGGPSPTPATAGLTLTPTTAAPIPATTTTTRPPGVPSDWPANKPIPPMPPNCRQPQLEDNGVWNCQR